MTLPHRLRAAARSCCDPDLRALLLEAARHVRPARHAHTPDTREARWRQCAELRAAGMSLPAIGRAVGMDHSSVLYALRRMGAA